MKVPFSTYTTEAVNHFHLTLAPFQASITAPIEYRVVAPAVVTYPAPRPIS